MNGNKTTLSEAYFDHVYNANTDPWNFETSGYEKEKYKVTINALPKPMYKNVFEVGCSIGVLSEMLAPRAEKLLCADASESPLVQARLRLHRFPSASVQKMNVPAEFGIGEYDLIVLSEVAYYLNDDDLEILRQKTITHLQKEGQLLMVHWTPFVHDYPQTGDRVHDYFLELTGKELRHLRHEAYDTYRLDLFEKI